MDENMSLDCMHAYNIGSPSSSQSTIDVFRILVRLGPSSVTALRCLSTYADSDLRCTQQYAGIYVENAGYLEKIPRES